VGEKPGTIGDDLTLPAAQLTGDAGVPILGERYRIVSLIGVGGMGTVYRAHDRELDEDVALKALRRELVDAPGVLARFRHEVKLARRVTHPNVARVYDIGEHDGTKFLTMELVDGPSLAVHLRKERALPAGRIVDIAAAVCAGLGAAHAAGVIHRDLKPDNVLLAADGRIVVTDFGIARLSVDGVTLGTAVGTPAYMAPEQVEGGAVDERADLYALGVMLFELATGERPFGGDSIFAVANARLRNPPPDPRARRPEVPETLSRLIQRLMARAASERFADAGEVAAALATVTVPTPQPFRVTRTPVPTPSEPLVAEKGDKTVAVLPLENLGDAADDYLADGLTEDLIDGLSMVPGLRVRARGAVMRARDPGLDAREMGTRLDVQVVVDGSVRRHGDRLQVRARLISVGDGFQLWAKRFDRPAAAALEVSDEALSAIAAALTVDRPAEQARAQPLDPEALDLYLRGRHELHKFWQESTAQAVQLLAAAHARAPEDPPIMASYAMALMRRFGMAADEHVASLARSLAERALAQAPQLGEARVALVGLHLNAGELTQAAREARTMLARAPSSPDAHQLYGRILIELDRIERALRHLETARVLEPRLDLIRYDAARAHALLGDWGAADAAFDRAPTSDDELNPYWIFRARLCLWRRDRERAARVVPEAEATRPFALRRAVLALLALAVDGHVTPEMLAQVRQGADESGVVLRRRAFYLQLLTEVLVYAGQPDGALDALAASSDAELFDVAWLDRCPLLDPLRRDPRFAPIRRAVSDRAAAMRAILEG
jgi:serine/threonine-protein kinase